MSEVTPTAAAAPSAPASNSTTSDSAELKNASAEAINAIADEVAGDEEVDADEVEASSEDKAKAEKTATEAKKASDALKKKLKLKVNGKDLEEEIDFNDDARLTRALQKEKAFDAASQELATLKKQFGSFIETLKGGQVMDVLKELGHNTDELAEKHIQRLVEEAKKSPEQVEREKMEAELKALKKEKEDSTKLLKEKELEGMRNQMATEIENDITAALDKAETVLPKRNPKIIRNIAANMLFAMQNGYPDVTAKDVIPLVESEYRQDLKELFDVLPEDTIESLVGKENLSRIRKKRINTKKTQTANQIAQETGEKKKTNESDDSKNKKSYKNFFSYID